MDNFYSQYLNIVGSADNLLTRPAIIRNESTCAIQDVERYCAHLSTNLPALREHPSLAASLFNLIDKEGMTGHLGEYIIDNALQKCEDLNTLENEILSEIDRIIDARGGNDETTLQDISEKAKSWHRVVSIDNINHLEDFLRFLKRQVDKFFDSLSAQERLGQALAQSEEERRRLIELEEARKRGITEQELSKEEKRQKAREEFAKNIRTRKKK